MNATIITIGDELLIGQVVDTNSAWLGAELTKIGFQVRQLLTISDTEVAINNALDLSLPYNDLIVFSGGLGPTRDDITKHVLASYFNSTLEFSEEVLKDVESFISFRGSKMNQLNRNQALFPSKAKLLANKQGTAPGMWFENNETVVISVPGVPSEMKGIFEQFALLQLQEHFKLDHSYYKTILINGIAEAHLAEKLSDWESKLDSTISVAYLPSPGVVRLRLGARGSDVNNLKGLLQPYIDDLHAMLPTNIFGYGKDTIAGVIGKKLVENNKTIATAESCTGGQMAHFLTLEPGSSAWYRGSVVAYHNSIKENVLGVDSQVLEEFGAVSQPVVEQMVKGVKKALGTDYAIATSGIAGPGGGSKEKPVGMVWVAIAGPNFVKSKCFKFGKDRAINIKNASMASLVYLYQNILEF